MTLANQRKRNSTSPVYQVPTVVSETSIDELLRGVRSLPADQHSRLLAPTMFEGVGAPREATLYYAGDSSLLRCKNVAIVGSRKASIRGSERAGFLASELTKRGVVVTSGLAEGIDTASHLGAIEAGGRTIAVIGTPLDKAYPANNWALQERIWREHLLISPFRAGAPVFKSSFPHRNRVMAALSDATVIIEASDTSGSLHQAAECLRLGRWLFIAESLVRSTLLTWPSRFLNNSNEAGKVKVLRTVDDVLAVLE